MKKDNKTINLSELVVSDNTEFIFTDFFDTLVHRKCHPEEIKKRWCAQLIDFFNLPISSREFYDLRNSIESELCGNRYVEVQESEFKYEELITLLWQFLKSKYLFDFSESEFFDTCLNIELSLEKKSQEVNLDVVNFLENQIKLGIKIVIVSDFYCGKDFIKSLSDYHGFSDLVSDIYVSSDYFKSKRSGKLYEYLIETYHLNPNNVLMIGDNYHSDYKKAKDVGINSIHIDRSDFFKSYDRSFDKTSNLNNLKKDLKNVFSKDSGKFLWAVIPLYIFTIKLIANLNRNNEKDVIFLAREGEFLKEIFDVLSKDRPSRISSHYMYASRRGTYLPSLSTLDDESFEKLFRQYPKMSLSTFLKTVGLCDYISILQGELEGISFDEVHEELKTTEPFQKLISSTSFRSKYEVSREEQNKYLRKYLDSLISNKVVNLVDVGWKGSIQDNIHLATKRSINGYYCCILSGSNSSSNNVKNGLLFRQLSVFNDSIYNEFRASYEIFCGASHGSLIRYSDTSDFGILEDNRYETELFTSKIRPYQKNFLNVITVLEKLKLEYSLTIDEFESILLKFYAKGVYFPSDQEVKEMSEIKHYENFGTFNYSQFDGESNKSRFKYIIGILKNPSYEIGKEWWKPAAFTNNGCSFLKYIYYSYKKFKLGF
ncbi:hypothetical protein CW749_19680 [Vibrio sp. vnigr-6D03]|uniref:HAD hydrolase-like protein n=1 Tax=Vibrio sp. vnigr-6D03 TaxID=2058088 RepID=UPI000C3421B4|nr:HAD hydrolase-like protein [Vibrio sp. vnigr-6D03]PKF77760.1 hypothetical protein CW749_19680 [Vibrio sp. vnigr-6D03]